MPVLVISLLDNRLEGDFSNRSMDGGMLKVTGSTSFPTS